MKKNKIKQNISIIFIIFLICFLYLISFISVKAEEVTKTEIAVKTPEPSSLTRYIKTMVISGYIIVGAVALLMIIYGAIRYIASAGNPSQKEEAKDIINKALLGTGLLLISYILLNTINPDLVKLKEPNLLSKKSEFEKQMKIYLSQHQLGTTTITGFKAPTEYKQVPIKDKQSSFCGFGENFVEPEIDQKTHVVKVPGYCQKGEQKFIIPRCLSPAYLLSFDSKQCIYCGNYTYVMLKNESQKQNEDKCYAAAEE